MFEQMVRDAFKNLFQEIKDKHIEEVNALERQVAAAEINNVKLGNRLNAVENANIRMSNEFRQTYEKLEMANSALEMFQAAEKAQGNRLNQAEMVIAAQRDRILELQGAVKELSCDNALNDAEAQMQEMQECNDRQCKTIIKQNKIIEGLQQAIEGKLRILNCVTMEVHQTLQAENAQLYETLTRAQAECTELVLEKRSLGDKYMKTLEAHGQTMDKLWRIMGNNEKLEACNGRLEAENHRLSKEHTQVHEVNTRLLDDVTFLRRSLREYQVMRDVANAVPPGAFGCTPSAERLLRP